MTRRRKIVMSALAAGVLAGVVAGSVSPSPPHMEEARSDASPLRPDVMAPPSETVSVDEEARLRPIFARGRRPAATSAEARDSAVAPPSPPPLPRVIIAGVLMGEGRKAMLLRREGVARAEVVNEGDMLGEWRLSNVTIDGAEWVHPGGRVPLGFPPRSVQPRGGGRR